MKVIDANSGLRVKVGDTFENVDGRFKVIDIHEEGYSRAWIHLQCLDTGRSHVSPLTVRCLHPAFLFQKIGFINS
jgi:hypothetical protein